MLEEEIEDIDEDLKKIIKKEAILTVKSLLSSPEQLDQIDIFLAKENKKKAKYEEEMTIFISNFIDNLKSTLTELRISLAEASCLQSDLNNVQTQVQEYVKNEKKIEKITNCSLKVSTIFQALFWLRQIVNLNITIDETKKMLDDMQLLNAHKKVRELENVRDKIFSKHFDKKESQDARKTAERNLLAKSFEPIKELDSKLFEKVLSIIENFLDYCKNEPSSLVTALRIIEREEKVDEYWRELSRDNIDGCYIPEGRPKSWASHVDLLISQQFEKKIKNIELNINFEDKLALTELLELIKSAVINDISIIQTNGQRCFPPSYKILSRVTRIYHKIIGIKLNDIVNKWQEAPEEADVVAVLLFTKNYFEDSMFGNSKFDHIILQTIRNSPPLFSPSVLQRLEHMYLVNVCENLTSKVTRIISIEKSQMESNSPPKIFDDKYRTFLKSFYDDFVGLKIKYAKKLSKALYRGVFKYCIVAFEQFLAQYEILFENYVSEQFQTDIELSSSILTFTNLFKGNSQQRECAPKFPNFVEYCIAIANNCIQIRKSIDRLCLDMLDEMGRKSDNILSKSKSSFEQIDEEFSNRILSINQQIDEFSNKCIITITNDYFLDLSSSFDDFLSLKWQKNAVNWSEGFQGSLCVFSEILVYLEDCYLPLIYEILDKNIAKRYIYRFLSHKSVYDKNQLEEYGQVILNDANFLCNFFSNKRSIEIKDTYCYTIVLCATILKASDQDCALIDLAKIFTTYSDFNGQHATAILKKRFDVSKDKLNETVRVIEYRRSTGIPLSGVFCDINLKK